MCSLYCLTGKPSQHSPVILLATSLITYLLQALKVQHLHWEAHEASKLSANRIVCKYQNKLFCLIIKRKTLTLWDLAGQFRLSKLKTKQNKLKLKLNFF